MKIHHKILELQVLEKKKKCRVIGNTENIGNTCNIENNRKISEREIHSNMTPISGYNNKNTNIAHLQQDIRQLHKDILDKQVSDKYYFI